MAATILQAVGFAYRTALDPGEAHAAPLAVVQLRALPQPGRPGGVLLSQAGSVHGISSSRRSAPTAAAPLRAT